MTFSPEETLAELKRSAQESSASLVELELDPERRLLEEATLEGMSADRRSRASALSMELWRRQALLEDLLVRAEEAGRRRRSPDLTALLEGPSIDLGQGPVKPEARSLLAAQGQLCFPGELLTGMAAMFDEVKGVYELFAQTWKALIPRLESVQALAESAKELADANAGDGRRRVEASVAAVASLARAVARDPLSISPEAITGLTDELESLRAELERSVELRTTFPVAFATARTQLGVLREVHAEARAAREKLTLKIANPSAPPPQHDETLDIELVSIGQLAQDGAWVDAWQSLDALCARIDAAVQDARHSIDAYRAPVDARNQLRNLLQAYQVKASRLGLIEQPDVAAIYRAAEAELYVAPTDLARAEKLVRGYQDALSDSPTGEVER